MVPGRILVIDNSPDEVSQLIETLKSEGENVSYFMSLPDDKFLENVRLLVLDLILDPRDEDASYQMVAGMIKKISEKSGFVVVAIWTKAASNNPASDRQITNRLKDLLVGTEFKGVVLDPFGKDGISQKELFIRLKNIVSSNPQCSLLLEIERSVEAARDKTVSEILSVGSVPLILKVLKEEVGEAALSREMVELYIKILARNSTITEEISTCVSKTLAEISDIDDEKYGHMYNLQSYYQTLPNERAWTGDVLEKEGEFAVIITPACDFAQNKDRPLEHLKMIHAFRIDHHDLTKEEKTQELCSKLKIKIESRESCIRAIFEGRYLQRRFYILRYLKDASAKTLYHLVLDFQQVSKLPFRNTKTELEKEEGWKSICRIDSPIIEDLLHEYSAYSSRIGTQSIPTDIVEKIVEKTKTEPNEKKA